jgi:fructoselysine-6-P-deglycase FrlB-like protein
MVEERRTQPYVVEEINSQPRCWSQAVQLAPIVKDWLPKAGERVAVIGCGTSWFVAMAYACLRESAGEGITDAFTASEFPAERDYDCVVAISRSGTTTEVIAALHRLPASSRSVALVGVLGTPVAVLATEVIDLSFADEQSVVQTRFPTTVLALLRAHLGEDLSGAIAECEAALVAPIAERWIQADQVTYLGCGWMIGLAQEAALKMRESSQTWAEAYPAMDYRHGPIAIAQPGRVVWMFGTAPDGLEADVAHTGADWIHSDADPMAHLVLAQRFAVARAIARGLDPDHPRNLTRSVILDAQA